MAAERQYWLFKSEAAVFSFSDLQASLKRTAGWDGVRNYQARNFLRAMRRGDLIFFYHSNAEPSGIVGIAEVVREAYPDPTQFDKSHEHFDARSKIHDPSWVMVDIRAVEVLSRTVALAELRAEPALAALHVCQKASRLSVSPVQSAAWGLIQAMAKRKLKP